VQGGKETAEKKKSLKKEKIVERKKTEVEKLQKKGTSTGAQRKKARAGRLNQPAADRRTRNAK